MAVFNSHKNEDMLLQLAKAGIKYGVSVGRRQPMHLAHLDCAVEIARNGLIPAIIIGSANGPDSPFYDPVKNPLPPELQRIQIEQAMKKAGIKEYKILELPDFGDDKKWAKELAALLVKNDIDPKASAFHFREKDEDQKHMQQEIKPLSVYQSRLIESGFSIWTSENFMQEFSGTELRSISLRSADKTQISKLATPEFIISEANAARIGNPDSHLLEHLPLTMLDISLTRLLNEKGLRTSEITNDQKPKDLSELTTMIYSSRAITKPSATISGEISVEGPGKGIAHG